MSTTGISSILAAQTEATNTTGTSSTDKDMFLKLLVTQLQNQDPLNPTEDTEFISQLAQFTTVEKLDSINTSVDNIYNEYQSSQLVNSASLIGKLVLASGSSVAKGTDSDGNPVASIVYFTNDEQLSSCTLTITNSAYQIIWSEDLGAQATGQHTYSNWPGTDSSGNIVADGVYTVSVTGTNAAGESVLISTQVYGQVVYAGLLDGEYYLSLNNGTEVKFTDVSMISDVSTVSGNSGDSDSSSSDSGSDDSSDADDSSGE